MLPRTGSAAQKIAVKVKAIFQNILLCIGRICIVYHIHSAQSLIA